MIQTLNVVRRRRGVTWVAVAAIGWSLSLFAASGTTEVRADTSGSFVFEGERFGRQLAGDIERKRLREPYGPIGEVMLQSRGDVSNRLVQIYGCRHLGKASSDEADKAVEAICVALRKRYGLTFSREKPVFREGMRWVAEVGGIGVLVRWHSNFFQGELVADMTLRNFDHEIQLPDFSVSEVLDYRIGETLEDPAELRQKFWKFERIVPQCRSEHVIDGIYAVHDVSGLDRAAAVAEFEEARAEVEKLHGIRLYKTVDYDDVKRYDFDGKGATVSVKFEYLEKKQVRYSVTADDILESSSPSREFSDFEGMMFFLAALIVIVVVWEICVRFGRYAAGRIEIKRVNEMGELQGASGGLRNIPLKGAFALWGFCFVTGGLLGFEILFVSQSFDWCGTDPIFGQCVPWCGAYYFLLGYVMILSFLLAMCGVVFPKTARRTLLWTLAVLELSFAIHMADAFSYWGYGMSFVACVHGFVGRCLRISVFLVMPVSAYFALVVPAALCLKSVRHMLTRCNLTCTGYFDNLLNLVVWFGLLGLLVYEALILVWLNFAF